MKDTFGRPCRTSGKEGDGLREFRCAPSVCVQVALQFTNDYNDHGDLVGLRGVLMGTQSWTVAEAKAKFSEIIERAMSEGPQTITRKGRVAAVVVGAEEWQRKTKRVGNLAEFFVASPLRGSGLKVRRLKEVPRKTSL
jgi:prevent-host-death family protein